MAQERNTSPIAKLAVVDVEVGISDHRIHDIGAVRHDGSIFHQSSKEGLLEFLENVDFVCGHNIIHHDVRYLFDDSTPRWFFVDTLYVSPLLFPERPYHKLLKDDKLVSEQMNNPVNDCEKAYDLLMDEISQWHSLTEEKQRIFATLLKGQKEFEGFLKLVGAEEIEEGLADEIRKTYKGKCCQHADFEMLIQQHPCELAYALALVDTSDVRSVTPGWVLRNYPEVEQVVKSLRDTHCEMGCDYCNEFLDIRHQLKTFFGYDQFRTYEGEPLQERAAQAAADGLSLLAIFPTGGGKSLLT